jgi:long-chain acyl-CoA synthetase
LQNVMNNNRYKDVLDQPEQWLTDRQRQWLRPRSVFAKIAYAVVYVINWVSMRLLFRLRVVGLKHLPTSGPFIVTPNHSSPLDPPVLAAALPLALLQQTYWAGKQSTVMRNRKRRILSWLTRVIPIGNDCKALAPALKILHRGGNLVWFPEGKRSIDGQLQEFRPGIGYLITRCDVPVVPVFIDGAYSALPSSSNIPQLWSRIIVRIGPPVSAAQLGLTQPTVGNINRAVETLRQRVSHLQHR